MSEKLILLVEDDPAEAEMWKMRLVQAGYYVIVTHSVEKAIDTIDNVYFHVAIIDQSLDPKSPGYDNLGLEVVARHLKQKNERQELPNVPFIILTAYPSTDHVINAYRRLGAHAYIRKNEDGAGKELLDQLGKAFETKIQCNFELMINYHGGLSLDRMISGLRIEGINLNNPDTKITIATEMHDLLCKLFHHCSHIEIFPLEKGFSGAGIAIVLPYQFPDGKDSQLVYELIKYGDVSKIKKEIKNHEDYGIKIEQHRRPHIELKSMTKHLGGIRYTCLGVPLDKATDFHTTYRASEGSLEDQINLVSSILDDMFFVALHIWYGEPGSQHPVNFKAEYSDRLLKSHNLQIQFTKLFPDSIGKPFMMRSPKFGTNEFMTFVYNIPNLPMGKSIIGYDEVVTHGDLNGRNILVYDGKAWLIDFCETGKGHIFRDFVKLESYIKFHLLETENMDALNFLEDALNELGPLTHNKAFVTRGYPEEIVKAYRIILKLRDWARIKAMEKSWGKKIQAEYYTGLFYQTLAVLQYEDIKIASKKHALISANKIYNLLMS